MSNKQHRYSQSADIPPSLRAWSPSLAGPVRYDGAQMEETGRSAVGAGSKPMPPIPQAAPYHTSSVNGQSQPYSSFVAGQQPPRYDGYDTYRRSAGNTPIRTSSDYPAYPANASSPIRRQYNPQDYASVTQASPYQPAQLTRPSIESPVSYQAYNPARYQEPTSATSQYSPQSPTKGASPYTSRTPYQHYATPPPPPPPPPRSITSSPAYYSQSCYGSDAALPPTPTRTLSQPYPPPPPRNFPLQPLSTSSRDPQNSAPSTPTSLHRNSSAAEIYSQISNLAHSPSLHMPGGSSGPHNIDAQKVPTFENMYDEDDKRTYHNEPTQAGATQPSLERSRTTGRHPQSRPLPGPPPDPMYPPPGLSVDPDDDLSSPERLAQDELYEQLDRAIDSMKLNNRSSGTPSGFDDNDLYEEHESAKIPKSFQVSEVGRSRTLSISAHVDDDDYDPEAAAGIAAMRAAEQEDALFERRHSVMPSRPPIQRTATGFSSVDVDLSSYEGGADVSMAYDAGNYANDYQDNSSYQQYQMGEATDGRPMRHPSGASMFSFTGSIGHGYIDQAGTGGLQDNAYDRRLSFDEGDESGYLDDQAEPGEIADNASPRRSGTLSRPLPPPPEGVSPFVDNGDWPEPLYDQPGEYPFPAAAPTSPPSFQLNNLGVPRSISLLSPRESPTPRLPDRAKTDADERRKQGLRAASYGFGDTGVDAQSIHSRNVSDLGLDLPVLPTGRRFQPAKLTYREFDRCTEPWALSSISSWLRSVTDGESELREQALIDALVALFTFKVPNIHIADAEDLAGRVLSDLKAAGVLIRDEEWLPVRFTSGTVSGVLFQLTTSGCYAPSLHEHDTTGKCYAHLCQRTVKRITLAGQSTERKADWATFHKLKKEDIENVNKKEVERQNILHEIVMGEYDYLDDLNLLKTLYRDGLRSAKIMGPKELEMFTNKVFGKLDAVQHANQEFLLPQLRYRQHEQGPWIVGFSDIFRDWIRKAKVAYVEYAGGFPEGSLLMKQHEQKNTMFSSFLENARNNPLSRRLGWDNFLKAPITRLQRYGLLLQTVQKKMTEASGPESTNLQLAMDEIRAVTKECDAIVAVQGRKAELVELSNRLQLREEMKKHVELNLENKGRELLLVGDLQRMGTNKFTWLETHAILLDNYLILAKSTTARHLSGTDKSQKYDVSKMPIPMRLLELDSTDDDPVMKSRVGGVSSAAPVRPSLNTVATMKSGSLSSPSTLTPTTTNTDTSLVRVSTPTTPLDNDKTLYPFRVKHLGTETYTLYANRAEDRRLWCDKIIEAKTKHAAALFRQNAEPFTLRVLADAAFAYDTWSGHQRTVLIKGTSLSRALDDVERQYANVTKPVPICRAKVNCAASFTQADGKVKTVVGTDYGIYLCNSGGVRDWIRVLTSPRVTQLAVLEDFNLLILISDKALIAYHLDSILPASGSTGLTKKPPQKLSGSRDVAFFSVGRMKDRYLIFYKKREGLTSVFKVLEPVLHRSTAVRRNLTNNFGDASGTKTVIHTDTFRDYDDFTIQSDSTALSLFTSTIGVATSRGFDVLNLDKKAPWAIPDLSASHTIAIAKRLEGLTPLGMFRLPSEDATVAGARSSTSYTNGYSSSMHNTTTSNDSAEYILVYDECAIYITRFGEISRGVHMEFVGKARSAALVEGFLVLFDSDFVEVRDAQTGRLKQIISGRDVRAIDDGHAGGGGGGTIKVAMQHPEMERYQIVLEMVLNRGMLR